MSYLITQTFLLLLIAGLLGLALGWYLMRMAAAGALASLQARLANAEADARALRTELDAAVNARGNCEAERKGLADALAALRALRGEDTSLDEAGAPTAPQATPVQLPAASATATGMPWDGLPPIAAQGSMGANDGDPAPPPAETDAAGADDLQRIKGIGPKIAGILGDLGVRRFDQIAAWTPQNVAWVNEHLRFKGRIEREEWIPQAKALMAARELSE